jgi:SAM-dependent methyltransferase
LNRESFRPVANTPPTGWAGKTKFFGRMLLDLQVLTIYRAVRDRLPNYKGDVLDVGCGQSPYRFLLDPATTRYVGIDIIDADKFDYRNSDVVTFDGVHIPFPDDSFDAVICTEVLEHVADFQGLVDEIRRVMKEGAEAIVTVPWSARRHYVPYDYFRYTPSTLATVFDRFREVEIETRGTDVSTIVSKLVILWFRNLFPQGRRGWWFVPLWIVASPILAVALVVAHVCMLAGVGSNDDPLGYTIVVTK